MTTEFLELPWHDAEILSLTIDRRSPGEKDCVDILVCWPNGEKGIAQFTNCYAFEAKLNFGIIAPESIRNATLYRAGHGIEAIMSKWQKDAHWMLDLKCFEIETNSTASTIRIYATDFNIAPQYGNDI